MSVEEDDLEWEEWKPNQISFVYHMVAGSMAGLAEHVSIFPIGYFTPLLHHLLALKHQSTNFISLTST